MKTEYFKYESLPPANTKKEPVDKITLKEEPVSINEEPDIELEFQKLLSGIDLINTLLQDAFKDETLKIKNENKYLTVLDNMEEKMIKTKKY